ncbi:40-kDa huntingtin-associated protein [Plecturocebus cupreus]
MDFKGNQGGDGEGDPAAGMALDGKMEEWESSGTPLANEAVCVAAKLAAAGTRPGPASLPRGSWIRVAETLDLHTPLQPGQAPPGPASIPLFADHQGKGRLALGASRRGHAGSPPRGTRARRTATPASGGGASGSACGGEHGGGGGRPGRRRRRRRAARTEAGDFLARYRLVSNKLKKRFLRKPNVAEAGEQFGQLGRELRAQECLLYAAWCQLAVARCQQALFHGPGEALALTEAARLFLRQERDARQRLVCPAAYGEPLQAAASALGAAVRLHLELGQPAAAAALCLELAAALRDLGQPAAAAGHFQRRPAPAAPAAPGRDAGAR